MPVDLRDYIDYVKLRNVGDTYRTTCPICGATHEETFIARRTNPYTILYKCYRVSCGARGAIIKSGVYAYGEHGPQAEPDIYRDRSYKEPIYSLPDSLTNMLSSRYDIGPRGGADKEYRRIIRDIGTDFTGEKIVLVWRDETGEECGHLVRDYYSGTKRTWIPHLATGKSHSGYWPLGLRPNTDVVLVEDAMSAIRLSLEWPGVSTCALLGTSLGNLTHETMSKYIHAIRKVVIFLDPDANEQANKLARSLREDYGGGLHNKDISVVLGHRADPKDLLRLELEEIKAAYRIGDV